MGVLKYVMLAGHEDGFVCTVQSASFFMLRYLRGFFFSTCNGNVFAREHFKHLTDTFFVEINRRKFFRFSIRSRRNYVLHFSVFIIQRSYPRRGIRRSRGFIKWSLQAVG